MATIDFYTLDASGPCRTVETVARILGVNLNKTQIDLMKGEQLAPEYVKLNPRHKVPFIVDGDLKLNESRAIAAYLVNKYATGDSPLYPKCPAKRALVDEALNFDLGQLYPSMYNTFSPIFKRTATELNPDNIKAMKEAFQVLDTMVADKKFVTGDDVTIADISLLSGLTFVEMMDYSIEEFKSLSRYYNDLKANVPHYEAIHVPAIELVRQYLKKE